LYNAELERYGVLDFDDILLKALSLFESGDVSGKGDKSLGGSFAHLLVDEFQDVSDVQYRLIKEWGKNSKSIFVIGDPNQSIYGFRGSDPRYFDMLSEDFPQTEKYRLTQNYRSTPEILRCAGSVIPSDEAGHADSLLAKRESGARVSLLKADSAFSEALFVAKEINRLVGGIDMLDAHTSSARGGRRPASGQARGFSDIAVLYRTNRQAEMIEQCLLKEGIPYVVSGRDEFLSDREVRKAVAFFRFLLNPGDLVSLRACLRTSGACGEGLVQKIFEAYAEAEKGVSSLASVLNRLGQPAAENLQRLTALFEKYETAVHTEKPQKLIGDWISDNGLSDVRSMEMLLNMSVLHEGMPAFLRNLALGREADVSRSGGRVYASDAVSLMTMHAAKGLEFPAVFLCGLNEGTVPFTSGRNGCDPDEERRLFYVGMTRAKDELVLLTSDSPSSFLGGLPGDALAVGDAFLRRQESVMQQFSLF